VTILLLIRHALTDQTGKRLYGRSPGVHLSSRGREQAGALARRLAAVSLEAVYSSPLERCVETARPIAAAHGLRVRTVGEVVEIDYGRWTGRTFSTLVRTRLWRRVHGGNPSGVRFPGGESLAEAQRRGVDAVERIADRHPRGVVAVVTHGDVVDLVLAHYAGVHVDQYQRLDVAPASISAVALGGAVPKIRRLNDTGTLEDLVPPRRTRPR
jgi:probable phosphomutase (TIGR03848 family)